MPVLASLLPRKGESSPGQHVSSAEDFPRSSAGLSPDGELPLVFDTSSGSGDTGSAAPTPGVIPHVAARPSTRL
jgi:hypothetical protein